MAGDPKCFTFMPCLAWATTIRSVLPNSEILPLLMNEAQAMLAYQDFPRHCKSCFESCLAFSRSMQNCLTSAFPQVVREPLSILQMRAYIALLACTMKVLNELDGNPDHDPISSSLKSDSVEGANEFSSVIWSKLPGSASWDFATGSIGNTISKTLINQLGSRTFASLRQSGAELSKAKDP